MGFTVISSQESFNFVQKLYKEKVVDFLEDPRIALLDRKTFDLLIEVGSDLYLDFWNVAIDKYGSEQIAEIREIYETYG